MAKDKKLTLKDYIDDENLWASDDKYNPLDRIYFVDTRWNPEEEYPVPIYEIFTSRKQLRNYKNLLDSNKIKDEVIEIKYFQGYPVPMSGIVDLKTHLNQLQVTNKEMEEMIKFTESDYWQNQLDEWHKMIDGEDE